MFLRLRVGVSISLCFLWLRVSLCACVRLRLVSLSPVHSPSRVCVSICEFCVMCLSLCAQCLHICLCVSEYLCPFASQCCLSICWCFCVSPQSGCMLHFWWLKFQLNALMRMLPAITHIIWMVAEQMRRGVLTRRRRPAHRASGGSFQSRWVLPECAYGWAETWHS